MSFWYPSKNSNRANKQNNRNKSPIWHQNVHGNAFWIGKFAFRENFLLFTIEKRTNSSPLGKLLLGRSKKQFYTAIQNQVTVGTEAISKCYVCASASKDVCRLITWKMGGFRGLKQMLQSRTWESILKEISRSDLSSTTTSCPSPASPAANSFPIYLFSLSSSTVEEFVSSGRDTDASAKARRRALEEKRETKACEVGWVSSLWCMPTKLSAVKKNSHNWSICQQ